MATDIRAGRAYVELFLKNNSFLRGLKNARESVRQFGADIKAAGQAMMAIGGASLAGFGMASKRFADFDDQMRSVKAITQATQSEFEKLTNKAKALGASTSFTAVEVGSLMAELGRAGFATGEIEAMTGAVLDLARATGTDATRASGIMAASIRQFSMEAGDAERVADSLTAAANNSFNTVEQLGDALSYAGPVAKDFNLSIEETLAILGALGNVGIQGTNAGTAIRRLLTLTGAEAEKLNRIFGVEFADAAGNARPLVDVMDEINQATASLGTADRAKAFNEAFGLLGITGASAIAGNAESARDLLDTIKAAGGQASQTAEEMDSGLGGSFRKTMSAAEGLAISIGEAISKPLAGLVDIIQSITGSAIEWVQANRKAVIVVAQVAAAVTVAGAVMMGLGASILAVNMALTVFGSAVAAVGAIIALMLNPVTLIGAALLAWGYSAHQAAGDFSFLGESANKAIERIISESQKLSATLSTTFGGITDALASGDWALAGKVAIAGLKVVFLQGTQALTGIFGDFIGRFGTQIAGGDFMGAWDTVVLQMGSMWAEFSEGIVAVFTIAATEIANVWESTVKSISDTILEQSAKGGVFGKVASAILGVDLAEEQRRSDRLNDELGLDRESVLDGAKAAAQAGISGQADAFRNRMSQAQRDSQARTAAARGENAANIAGGTAANQSALDTAQAELLRLREEARKASQEAKALADDAKQDARTAIGGAAAGASGGMGSRVVGSFSAAALSAMGGASSPMERAAKAAERMEKKLDALQDLDDELGNILAEIRIGGTFS